MLEIVPIETPNLGDRSYLIHDGEAAVVVDPQRDVDRVLELAESRGVRIAVVAETHLHNDYLTGGLDLAARTGATYLVPAAAEVAYDRHAVADGDSVTAGTMTVSAIHTPGHTPHHTSYTVAAGGRVEGVFTGGSMLFGSVGRTDLVSPQLTERLTHDQYRSVRRLAELPPDAAIYPTHGFGSFCSATPATGTSSTIGEQRQSNPALVQDEDAFVTELIAGLDVYPAYYAHMAPLNAQGPTPADLTPPTEVDAAELLRRLDAGEWVVDVRARRVFARGHLPGVLGFDAAGNVVTYLGWLMPWGAPLTLLGESREQVAEVQRELVRIGVDALAGMAVGGPAQWGDGRRLGSYPVADFGDLAAVRPRRDGLVVLDVRRESEWRESHLDDAVHIPLHELPGRLGEVPDRETWVHCATGFRSSIAASLLDRAGREVVLIDDEYARAGEAGNPIVHPSEAAASR